MTDTSVIALLDRLASKNLSICTAESCTGGMISSLITEVPGSSRVFWGGFITYANEAKIAQLGVSQRTITIYGAVSEETVREMAEGALARSGTDVAVSVSGIAGPDGGTAEKPVGTVWLAAALRNDVTSTKKLFISGDRKSIRKTAATSAIAFILDVLNAHLT